MTDQRYQRNDKLLHANVGGDIVALDVDRGSCFGLQDVGVRIWELLEHPTGIEHMCKTLLAEYEVDPALCRADLEDFIKHAVAEGVVSPVAA